LLLARAHPSTDQDREAVSILRAWNFDASAGSAAAAIFQSWFNQLAPAFVGDELGTVVLDSYKSRFTFVTRFVVDSLTTTRTSWCDDVKTKPRESCSDTVTNALHEAVSDLTGRMGSDMKRWRWDTIHHAVFPHAGLDAVAALRPLLSRSIPHGGDWSTVNVGPFSADTPFEEHTVPGYREIIDLSPANDSRFMIDIGESGHFLSQHYDDYLRDWDAVRHKKMRMEPAVVRSGAIGTLTLRPR
jgi:penicillin amidase